MKLKSKLSMSLKALPVSMLILALAGVTGCSTTGQMDSTASNVEQAGKARGTAVSAEFPYKSKYVDVLGSRMHYIDEGTGDPILFIHGQPTSSYLWRNVIPEVKPYGRVIAVDLIGFGKSDKPDIEYRFVDHARYVDAFIKKLGLKQVTLVIHDWGSALGFQYAMRNEGNIKGLAFMEAIILPIPGYEAMPEQVRKMMQAFRSKDTGWELIVNQNMFIEKLMPSMVMRKLSEAEMNHYRAPFISTASRKPIWRWPNELPIGGQPADVAGIVTDYGKWLQNTSVPKLLIYAKPGALITEEMKIWCEQNLKNLKTSYVGEGLHFIQEDHPREIGAAIANWYQTL